MERYKGHEIRIVVSGPFACFTRPDLKVERVSYDILTPSAARNIVQAIYWHPGVHYRITQIDLLSSIKRMQIMRNELSSKISAATVLNSGRVGKDMYINPADDIMQRSAIILKDVKYCIHVDVGMTSEAHLGDSLEKYRSILLRRARKGQCYTQPYLGLKEFSANFKLLELGEHVQPVHENRDLGLMLYDLNYANTEHIRPMFFFAQLRNGVMNLRNIRLLQ